MEIKITVTVGDTEPIEVKVDMHVEGEVDVKIDNPTSDRSPYAVIFDETSTAWHKCLELNKAFLIQQQEYVNCILKKRGCLFLNEVYDMLGLPRTRAGQVVGWVSDLGTENGLRCVDFDIFGSANFDAVNGKKNVWVLDFNVDGDILKYL